MKYKALFLDMDGTFLDFHAAEREGFFKALRRSNIKADDEIYRKYSALNDSLWKAFERGEIEKDEIKRSRFGKLFQSLGIAADGMETELYYEQFLGEGHELMPYARETLKYLAERYPLYVVTNGFAKVQTSRLKLADIEKYMTGIFISEQIGVQKPQKEFFDACFEQIQTDLKPKEVLLIGDSLTSDILGAKNAGIASCWYNPEKKVNDRKIVPDYEICSLTELKELL